MGAVVDKMEAAGNKIIGKLKEEIGELTHNEKLEAEGKAQQIKGTVQDVAGSIKSKVDLGDDI